jgi:hypothetical protein
VKTEGKGVGFLWVVGGVFLGFWECVFFVFFWGFSSFFCGFLAFFRAEAFLFPREDIFRFFTVFQTFNLFFFAFFSFFPLEAGNLPFFLFLKIKCLFLFIFSRFHGYFCPFFFFFLFFAGF